MDPVTVIGSLLGLTHQAGAIFQYICSACDAPGEIQTVRNDIGNLLALFLGVDRLIKNDEHLAAHFDIGSLDKALEAIKELLDLVGGDRNDQNLGDAMHRRALSFIKFSLNDMVWPLKKGHLREICAKIERQKSAISLSLNTALMAVLNVTTNESRARAEAFQQEIQILNSRLHKMEKNNIMNHFLPQNDGMPNLHRDRKALQEPQTCDWISREQSFVDWLKPWEEVPRLRFIWIHGIPGAGKTVLASSIIEKTARSYNSHGYAYYYCLYSRKQDETIPFLTWVLRMLCKQKQNTILPMLGKAYDSGESLSVDDLLNCLEQVSKLYEDGVHIIVDAVDESQPRGNLLKVLSLIGTDERFNKVSLLCTSREESDIIEMVKQLGHAVTEVSMANKNVRDDIKRYIRAQLTMNHFFGRRYNPAQIEEIEITLSNKAKGMFRWAVCQLDVLRNSVGFEDIRRTLNTLPEDLFSTYERILTAIPVAVREFAKTALALTCSDTAEIPTAEVLVRASLYVVPFSSIGDFDDVSRLQQICGSLISITDLNRTPHSLFTRGDEGVTGFHRCNLAHYTVKEYLFSPSVANGEAKFFALSDDIVGKIDLKVVFAGLSHFGHFGSFNTRRTGRVLSRYEEYCLQMAEKALTNRRGEIIRDEEIRKLVTKSLAPGARQLSHLSELHGIKTIMREYFPEWNKIYGWDSALKACPRVGLLVNMAALNWRELANKYLESPEFSDLSKQEKNRLWTEKFTLRDQKTETLLGYCLREGQMSFLRTFFRHGASFEEEPEALYTAMKVFKDPERALDALKFLLAAGANPDPAPRVSTDGRGFAWTPLQMAIHELEYEWVELLLDEGADVNLTGTIDGVIPSGFDNTDLKGDRGVTLQEMGELTALDICSYSQPSWLRVGSDHVNRIRERIRELLKRHGAEEPPKGICDEQMTDGSFMDTSYQDDNDGHNGPIDLTIDFE